MNRIDECHKLYKEWCAKLGIVTISDVNRIIDEGKASWLVNVSEIWHEQNLSEIAQNIKDHIDTKKIIYISGPSSSGKTSFASKLQLHLRVLGIKAVSLSLDNYYLDTSLVPHDENGKPDFEALEAIDYPRFNENVYDLIKGKETVIPIFDFSRTENRSSETTLKLEKDEVIIVEGIHALNPALTSEIPHKNQYRIYCSALTALSTDDGERIKSRTTRLVRRLIRDYQFRNSSYDYTLNMWADVEKGAEKYIFPYTDSADIIFNSSLLYEFALYKNKLNEIFDKENALSDKTHYETVKSLSSLVNRFNTINYEIVPHNSIIREFIGGSSLIE